MKSINIKFNFYRTRTNIFALIMQSLQFSITFVSMHATLLDKEAPSRIEVNSVLCIELVNHQNAKTNQT